MALVGKAVVAIWNDILPEIREDFIEWHNREHVPERIAIPGFLRGRRYVADHGRPEYFTLYEAANQEVLTGAAYLERLHHPTLWTERLTPDFSSMVRGICRTEYSSGSGDGGFILVLHFDVDEVRRTELKRLIVAKLETITLLKGVVGVHLCITDKLASERESKEREGRPVSIPNWIIMIEGSSVNAIDTAELALSDGLAVHVPNGSIEKGLYHLEFSLVDFSVGSASTVSKSLNC